MSSLLPHHPHATEFKAYFAAEREQAKKTATHSLNWWQGLSTARRAILLEVAKCREPHPLCSEESRTPPGYETDAAPFSGHDRITVRMLVGFHFEGAVTSCGDASVDWHYPIGHLFRIEDRGPRNQPTVGLVVIHGHDGRPDQVYLPEGVRYRGEWSVAPLRRVSATIMVSSGEILFHSSGDEHYVDDFIGDSFVANLSPGSSKLLAPLCEAVLPSTESASIVDQSVALEDLAKAVAGS